MKLAWIAVLGLLISEAEATDVRDLSIEYRHFHKSARIAEMPGYQAKEGLAINFDLDLIGPLYWNNTVHATTDPGQYRAVGWLFEFGLRPSMYFPRGWDGLEIYYEHHSQHVLDAKHPWMKFPVNDSVGFRWVIMGRRD